jgi:catechol 2,3-dioxygenase-like lactoylglutathione lyase family enzyme
VHEHIVATAILPTHDIDETIEFYRGLGFTVDRFSDRYALVLLDGHENVHLEVHDTLDVEANRAAVYLNVPDVDEWHERLGGNGVDVGTVADEPWGMREFRVKDPWGNTIRIGTNR